MLYKKILCIILTLYFFQYKLLGAEYKSIKQITKKAYLRAGPGKWYPVKWILKVPGLPIKILNDNSDYNLVEIYDGTRGWVSKSLISKKKNVIVIEDTHLYSKKGIATAKIKKNVILVLVKCGYIDLVKEKCEVKNQIARGFVYKDKIWGDTK